MNHRNEFSATDDCEKESPAFDSPSRSPTEERARLYLLSFLLTGDGAKAEQCSVTGLDSSPKDNAAFRDWTHAWARRIVINNALRLIAPHPESRGHGDLSADYFSF